MADKKSSKGVTPLSSTRIEDAEKRRKRKKENKPRSKQHRYWDEERMLSLYKKILKETNSKKEEKEFWDTVSILVEKVYFSYPSIQQYYLTYDDTIEEIKSAQLRIIEEIHRALFITSLYERKKGKLFSFLTVIAKRWYIFFLNNRYEQVRNINYVNDSVSSYLLKKDSEKKFQRERDKVESKNKLELLYVKLQDVFLDYPEKRIVHMLFELLEDDANQKYVKYQRNFYNYLHRRKPKGKKSYFKEATLYFARHLKRALSDGFKQKYKLETTEACMKMSRKVLKRMGKLYAQKDDNR